MGIGRLSPAEFVSQRSDALDGVRGFAVLLVFLSHASGRSLYPGEFFQFQGIGHIGVYLFFVLSSFLLTRNLLLELSRNGCVNYRKYTVRRVFRIYPLYFTVVTTVFLIQLCFGVQDPRYLNISGGWTGYLQHILLVKGDSIFWTIPAEVWYYLAIPFVALAIHKWKFLALIVLAVVAAFFSAWTELLYPPGRYSWLPQLKIIEISHNSQFFEVFLIGSLFAGLEWSSDKFPTFCPQLLKCAQLGVFLIFAVTIFYSMVVVCEKILWFQRSDFWFKYHSWIFAVVFSLVVTTVARKPDSAIAKFFKFKILQFMGILGFSWYLLHFPVFQFLNLSKEFFPDFYGRDLTFFIVSWLLCSCVSFVSYRLLERPFMNLAKRL